MAQAVPRRGGAGRWGAAYLESHPIQLQEDHTKTDVLFVTMMNEYLKPATDEYLAEQAADLRDVFNGVHLNQLYRQITDILGSDSLMEQLNLAIRQRFLAVPVTAAFIQGLTHDPLYCLTYRDMETSKQAFQLVLEHSLRE